MRPTILLTTCAVLVSTALAVAQSPTAAPKGPASASSPATTATTATSTASPATSTSTTAATSTEPNEAEMMKQMMELGKLNENHKLLAATAGTWSYVVKMYMEPNGKPTESTGTATRKAVMGGRYVTGDYSGSFKMPGPDGKLQNMDFKGMSLDGYDNVKKKFVAGWVDNMGTGLMVTEGTYDAASKTLTHTGEYEGIPGMKWKVREVVKMPDKNHMNMEYFEDRGQGETKQMEINYTRKK